MKPNQPFPLWALPAVLLVCGAIFYVFAPSQRTLAVRFMQDGKTKRALEALARIPASEKARDPEFYELMRLRLTRRLLDSADQPSVMAHVKDCMALCRRCPSNPATLTEVVQSMSLLQNNEQTLALIGPQLSLIPPAETQALTKRLVSDALASNKPALAAQIYETLAPVTQETSLAEGIRLWRAAARPDRALALFERFDHQRGQGASRLGADLLELRFNLLREVGKNTEAFELASQCLDRSADALGRRKWEKRLEDTVTRSEQRRRLLEAYRQDAKEHPGDTQAWRRVAETALSAHNLSTAEEAVRALAGLKSNPMAFRHKLAQQYEWNGEPNRAFDLYLQLADQKDAAALDRLLALNPGLYRDDDVLRVLRRWGGDIQSEAHRLALARLWVRHAEYADADALYRRHLEAKPDDTPVLEEYATMLVTQQRYGTALGILQRLHELKPKDEGINRRRAELYWLLGDFDQSLQVYTQLARTSTDLATVLRCCTLAESTGNFATLGDALARAMDLKKEISPDDFIKLAYVFNLQSRDGEREKTLERGLQRFPASDALRLQLATLLVERKDDRKALALLSQNQNLKSDLGALQLYLDLMIRTRQYEEAEKFLRSGIDPTVLDAQTMTLLRATIYEQTRNEIGAERLHRKLYELHPGETNYALNYIQVLIRMGKTRRAQSIVEPLLKAPTPPVLKEAARVYANLGNYAEAERLQKRYLESVQGTDFQEWSDLGDIQSAAGHRSAAQRAYERALASAPLGLSTTQK